LTKVGLLLGQDKGQKIFRHQGVKIAAGNAISQVLFLGVELRQIAADVRFGLLCTRPGLQAIAAVGAA
jgi:hypothetical protein